MAPDTHSPLPPLELPRSDPMGRACVLALILWGAAMTAIAATHRPATPTEGAADVSSGSR